MNEHTLINGEFARAFLSDVEDPILKTILDMAYVIIVKKYNHPGAHRLGADLDLRFLTEVLVELFSDRKLMQSVLAGERPGAWDDEDK
jgi:hypothetical protein